MDPWQDLTGVLSRAEDRRRRQQAADGFWSALAGIALIWVLVIAYKKFLAVPPSIELLLAALSLVVLAVVTVIVYFKKHSPIEVARWLDQRCKFKEQVSAAVELNSKAESQSPWNILILNRAVENLKGLSLPQLMPWRLPSRAHWCLVLLMMGAILVWVPERRHPEKERAKREAEIVKDAGARLVEITKRQIAQHPGAMEPVARSLENVNEVGSELSKGTLSKAAALEKLQAMAEKLKAVEKKLGDNAGFKAMERAAQASSKGGGGLNAAQQAQMEKLQQQMGQAASANPDALEKLGQKLSEARKDAAALSTNKTASAEMAKKTLEKALADLSKQAREMGADLPSLDEAIAALAQAEPEQVLKDLSVAEMDLEKYREAAKNLEKLQMQMERLGKDLAEQLKFGQLEAAQSTLKKMAALADKAPLTDAQKAEMLGEMKEALKPAEQTGSEAGKALAQAVEQMKKGDQAGSAASMRQAAAALDQAIKEMSDAQAMLSSIESLQRAQMAIASGQGWSQTPRPGRPGSGEGAQTRTQGGVGQWSEDDSYQYPDFVDKWDNTGVQQQEGTPRGLKDRGEAQLADNLAPTRIKGQMTPGGPMPSITLKGVSIKGTSRVQMQEMVGAAQSDAESALNRDQVPRAYQGAVKDYFDDLKTKP